jgi:hypothetical protein
MLKTLYNWHLIEEAYNYVAVDHNGDIYAYSDKPVMHTYAKMWGCSSATSLVKRLGHLNSYIRFYDWQLTLERRPSYIIYTPQKPPYHCIQPGEPEW